VEARKRESKYFMCQTCYRRKGWTASKWLGTRIFGLCGWCASSEDEPLTPLRDLRDQSNRRADLIAYAEMRE
jgi:hypothetical protein